MGRKIRPFGPAPETAMWYDEADPERDPNGELKRSIFPVAIFEAIYNFVTKEMRTRFYHSIGAMALDEMVRDLNMTANQEEVTGKHGSAHTHRAAARHITELRKRKNYPSEIKYQ